MSREPPLFLPKELDTVPLVEITAVSARWARFLDTQSGKVHDGEAYRKKYEESLKDANHDLQ